MFALDAEALYRSMLDQIRTAYSDPEGVALAGILSGGAWLAERLARDLAISQFGVINVVLHRDDYAKKGLHTQARPTTLPFKVDGQKIVLIDDVLHTGRTIRAALNELYDFGRPAAVDVAVLVDRGERELPIAARFVGATVKLPNDCTLVLACDATSGAFTLNVAS